ncbi:MAG: glycosyltransferase [Patescibacteria group bacterium]
MSKISIIIPCFNEEQTIADVLKKIPKNIYEIIVIDNNSTDKTAFIAARNGAKVIKEKNQGYGIAIRRGFCEVQGEIIAVLDGDGQYPVEKITEIVEYLEKKNLDFISASRFPLKNKKSLSITRKIGNNLLTAAAVFIFGFKLKDSQSGMWIFRKKILDKIKLESEGMPLSEEIKLKVLNNHKLKFSEYPIGYRPRHGKSKLLPFKDGAANFLYLFKLKFKLLKSNRQPLWFLLGVIFLSLVIASLAAINIKKPFYHVTSDVNGQNGLAAINIVNNSAIKMRFGLATYAFIDNPQTGDFYTHHPAGFIWPTVWSYKLFGVSEATTRLGPLLFMLTGFWFFAYSLRKIFTPNISHPLMILAVFSILPGVIFYGETLELAIFSLPAAMISYSLFVAWLYRKNKLYQIFFFISVFLGGLIGWFFYLIIPGIIVSILMAKDIKKPWSIIITTSAVTILSALANMLHFYWLNGNIFNNLIGAFKERSNRPDFFMLWIERIFDMARLHFTDLFLFLALLGLIFIICRPRYFKELKIFFPWLLFPLLVFLIFSQWSTHPFGVIFLSPLIAILAGWLIASATIQITKKTNQVLNGVIIILIIFSCGFSASLKNINYFFNDFIILAPTDLDFLKSLKPNVDNKEICLGQNNMGIGYYGIIQWVLEKNLLFSPDCFNHNFNSAIIFNPRLGNFYEIEAAKFIKNGFVFKSCSGYLCLLEKQI